MQNTDRTILTITDAELSNADRTAAIPLFGRTALLNLATVLRSYGMVVDLESDELETTHTLTIQHPNPIDLMEERAKGGRPQKGEWPEGLDTDEQRLEWLDSVTVEEAMRVLGVSQSTVYRRIDSLSKKVRGRA